MRWALIEYVLGFIAFDIIFTYAATGELRVITGESMDDKFS
jgi:hypothetical protein